MKRSSLFPKKQASSPSEPQSLPSSPHIHHDPNFNFEAWFATPEMIAEPQKMMLEIVISWKGGIIDICHYTDPRRITFGNDPRADFCYALDDLPLPLNQNLFPLIEPGGQGFVLGFHTEMQGTVEHNGESFTLRELVKEGRAHYFAHSGCCYYPLVPGVQVQMDLNGLELALQFVPVPPIQISRIRQFGLQAPVLSFSVIAHLLFVIFAVVSGTSSKEEPPASPPSHKKATKTPTPLYLDPIYLHPSKPPVHVIPRITCPKERKHKHNKKAKKTDNRVRSPHHHHCIPRTH